MKIKKWIALAVVMWLLVACNSSSNTPSWDRVVKSVNNSTVNFYIWREDKALIEWFNSTLKNALLEKHGMHLNVVKIDRQEALDMLASDKKNENPVGEIDLLWVDEIDFKTLKKENLLYGPFNAQIKNVNRYLDPKNEDNLFIGGTPIEGLAVPFNQNQLTFYHDRDIIYDPPETLVMLEQLVAENKGLFSYPHPKDKVGGAFVRSIILNFTSTKEFLKEDLTKAQLKTLIQPGVDYLKKLAPHLYKNGTYYPETKKELFELFGSGELLMAMSMNIQDGNKYSGDGRFPIGTRPFVLKDVSVGDKDYLAIAYNAQNKSGAMVVIDELLSLDLQISKLRDKSLNGLPVYNVNTLDSEVKTSIQNAVRKRTVVKTVDLIKTQTHDIPTKYHQWIVEIWQDEVLITN